MKLDPIVLRPTAPTAPDALLPGDPASALALAQALLSEPRMSNHAHGLWGYHGDTAGGRPLTIQSTGIGAPSAGLVLRDLAALGVRRAIRVGTCVGLAPDLELGELLMCTTTLAEDGTSHAIGTEPAPDAPLLAALGAAAGHRARPAAIVSSDVIHPLAADGPDVPARAEGWKRAGAVAAEMQTGALFALGAHLGVAVACVLVVSDLAADGRAPGPFGDEELAAAQLDAAGLALEALGATAPAN